MTEEQAQSSNRGPTSREEVLCFLNELGWLFQKNQTSELREQSDFSLARFKFLLVCSVERDYCALIRTLLDMLVERNLVNDELNREALDMLAEIQLLNRAVKRKSTKMVELLIHYLVNPLTLSSSRKFVFLPNITGPGGITPLHLAACTSGSDDMIDLLTNDPQEVCLSLSLSLKSNFFASSKLTKPSFMFSDWIIELEHSSRCNRANSIQLRCNKEQP